MNISNNILVVSIQNEMYDEIVIQLQEQILEKVHEKRLKGVLIDVSGMEIIDPYTLKLLENTTKMIRLLGAKTAFTGIKPEIVASLIVFGNISANIKVVLNVDEGLQILT
ncbi:MAG: STAS domain-containing protein [Flavobacteriales bacterium]|nr:STAS domain-containing protein [Flavobacteriales bacterium]